ncbi:P-type conjugative transfer protein TrbG [Methylovorus glucosotrophus]|uniref:Conjugal transfer protein TrbG/VirB9/CagX n=1 Tax=Methylovorus glucosotrophus (strain SIP3-4) TaxID=582744 RepID=C6XER8_METGS|nr:P-type conjugative transfer protein TrbG [Methylovorus glucosotrophus]ACT52125.1 Conjugal transfer protein TrbG/VirB9/CagX [Methylovorus glucosotrophus SIP3-4]
MRRLKWTISILLMVVAGQSAADTTIKKFLSADEAVISAVKRWQQTGRAKPIVSDDGTVYYPFGQYQAKVICSPIRVCDIALQAGEKITDAPSTGDDVRWSIFKSVSGSNDLKVNHVVVKPKDLDLETNLIIRTDRRVYHIDLISRNEGEYINQVAFYYPNDIQDSWRDEELNVAEKKAEVQAQKEVAECTVDIEHLDTAYEIKGGTPGTRPKFIYNNGTKTCILMPDDAPSWEAAAFVIIGKDDKKQLTNYRVLKQWYVIDKVFDHGALLVGENGSDSRTDIIWKKSPKQADKPARSTFLGIK